MRFSRTDRSVISEWWFSVDRKLIGSVLAVMVLGALISLAASPGAASRLGEPPMHFFARHLFFLLPSALLLIGASMLNVRQMRRVGLILFFGGLAMIVVALVQGIERNGAVRWLDIGSQSIQPSEFAKPGFVILTAWLFGESSRRQDMPTLTISLALLAAFAALLVAQPDIGQTFLITLVWGGLFFLAGYSVVWIAMAIGAAGGGLFAAYLTIPHVRSRFDRFWDPGAGDTHQTDTALAAFREGGWFGRGPGEGRIKLDLPDAHTDYIFAVIAEEFGIILCLVLVAVYAFIVWRGFRAASRSRDPFIRLALSGLMMLFGFQALINMAVNVDLLPAKGMTLPFISYGGSSILAMALTMGLALGLARRRPEGGSLYRSYGARAAASGLSSRGIRI
jgi:cell division protein FtsW